MMPLSLLILALTAQPAPRPSNQSTAYGLFLEALSLREDGKADEALKVLQRTLKADPMAADAHAEIARIEADKGRFDQAVIAVNQAIKIAPSRADLRSLAGQIHQFNGQSGGGENELRLAISEYETAATLSPSDPSPLRDLTRLYSVLRDTKGALNTWKRLSVAEPRNVDAFVQVASLLLATGDTLGAVEALETATAADPGNVRVLQLLGDIKQEAGQAEEALGYYRAAAKLNEGDLITRLKMGEILIDTHRGVEALATAEETLKQDSSNRFALGLKARAFKELGRMDEALEVARSLSAGDPKDLKAAFLVVTILEQKGSLAAASEKLDELLRRDTRTEDKDSVSKNNRVFWAHAGMVRQRLGRYREAAEAFGEALNASKEKDAALLTYRIDALISAKEFEKALAEARAARQEFKDETNLRFLEAYALRGTGDEVGATMLVDKILTSPRTPPNDPSGGKARNEVTDTLAAAEFFQRGKNFERAREMFDQATQKDSTSVRAFFGLGAVLERQKKFDEAEKAFRAALLLSPDSAIALNYLGYMNADRKVRVDEALTLIQKALTDDPDNGSYLDSLAWALHRLGRHEEAAVQSRKAVQSQDKSAVVIAHLGLILAAQGNGAEALKFLGLALESEDEDGELDRALVEKKIQELTRGAQKKP